MDPRVDHEYRRSMMHAGWDTLDELHSIWGLLMNMGVADQVKLELIEECRRAIELRKRAYEWRRPIMHPTSPATRCQDWLYGNPGQRPVPRPTLTPREMEEERTAAEIIRDAIRPNFTERMRKIRDGREITDRPKTEDKLIDGDKDEKL